MTTTTTTSENDAKMDVDGGGGKRNGGTQLNDDDERKNEEKMKRMTEAQTKLFYSQLRFLLLREVTVAPSTHSHSHSKIWTSFPNSLFGSAIDVNRDRDEMMSKEMLPWRLNAKLLQDPTLTVLRNHNNHSNSNELATTKTPNEEDMKFTENVQREDKEDEEDEEGFNEDGRRYSKCNELKRLFEGEIEARITRGVDVLRERVVKQKYTFHAADQGDGKEDGMMRERQIVDEGEWKIRQNIRTKSLGLLEEQRKLRQEMISEQRKIMALPERQYKKMIKMDEKQRELEIKLRSKKEKKELSERWRLIFTTRKRLNEESNQRADALQTRNRQMVKMHERMARAHLVKSRDDAAERAKRMEALKSNDIEAYKKLLAEAAKTKESIEGYPAGADGEGEGNKYEALQDFLSETEGYLEKLGGKIASVKISQARSEAATEAAAKAAAEGLDEDEIKEAAEKAAREATLANGEKMISQTKEDGIQNTEKYYAVAHSEQEIITEQPKMLTFGQLRDYQIVSLQWMVSLHNNRLNGILADEMGLGKTVQVCSLIAYLWESKQNFGPHIIIVPNAVIVNWKAELKRWLPNVNCVYYVGSREQRAKIFQKQVLQLKFNVLVTTYEFIMRDRGKLAKVNWKYIIIDEAQRLKDREGKLSRDLDKFRAQRRLLLTGTPLQNDLSELWSLLNLLLPEVFDSAKVFQQWFGKTKAGDNQGQKVGGGGGGGGGGNEDDEEDDWMEREKKVIVISRLHQILEPFMLRRLVQDVERKLPPRKSVVVHCPFSAFQSNAYSWINATGSIRVEPYTKLGLAAQRTFRGYLPLHNRCMELRKICNHPGLSYPPEKGGDFRGVNLIRSCGKLWILDRLLIKLSKTGHKVLLFSTMTKLLDLLEVYLKWRQTTEDGENLQFCRIDGTTPLEQREVAINDFNRKGSNKFIFLLSIRAAGRGLNLQTADTVVMYDPDPNPKNEEQAIARSHRIGQTREVRVIHLEAVDDKEIASVADASAATQEDTPSDGWGGSNRSYCESVESVVRNVIQQQKIEMADEVINAGRFDGQTTHSERRETLEKLMAAQAAGNRKEANVPSVRELNERICRSEEELKIWNELDDTLNWPSSLMGPEECPDWIRYTKYDLDDAIEMTAKSKAGEIIAPVDTSNLGRGGRSMNKLIANSAISLDAMDVDAQAAASNRRKEFVEKTGLKSSNLTAEQMSSKVKGGDEDDAFAIPMTKALLPFQKAQLAKAQAAEKEKEMQQGRADELAANEENEDEPLMMLDNSDEEDDYGNIEEDDPALNTSFTDVNLDNLTNEEGNDDDDDDGEDSIEEAPLNVKSDGGGMKLKFTMPRKPE
jgi:SWI/SNF-related matrix-associated actin-dependent regulator of chromatin subfamily A protein 2/4